MPCEQAVVGQWAGVDRGHGGQQATPGPSRKGRGDARRAVIVCAARPARPHPALASEGCDHEALLDLARAAARGVRRGAGGRPQGEAAAKAGPAAAPVAAAAELVPAYPGAVAVEVPNLGAAGTDSRSGNATASETGDSVEQVAQFYRERFAAAGMPIRVDSVTATGGTMGIGRDGEQGAMITLPASARRPGSR